MPLTPLHLGGGLFLGSLNRRFFSLWALLLGSVVMDIEPTILLLINPCYSCPHHGFFHSILGAIVGSAILATILSKHQEKLKEISLNIFKYKSIHPFSFKVLFFSALSGWLIHIFFDSLTHFDVFLFWPLKSNPIFISPKIYWPLNLILLLLGIFGLLLLRKKIKKNEI